MTIGKTSYARPGYTEAPHFLDGIPDRFYRVHGGMIETADPIRCPYITVPLVERVSAERIAEPVPSRNVTIQFARETNHTFRGQRWRLFPATGHDRKTIAEWMEQNPAEYAEREPAPPPKPAPLPPRAVA